LNNIDILKFDEYPKVETPQGSLLTPALAEDETWGKSGPVAPAYGDLGESGSED
jgi:hypothetical protein